MLRRGQRAGLRAALPALLLAASMPAPATPTPMQACRLTGVARPAWCAAVTRALDPARPDGPLIEVHFAVLPAQSRHALADPVLFFAGGPGQSAIELAGVFAARHARLNQKRDLVFIDQRGTGRSAPLVCDDDLPRAALRPLALRDGSQERLRRLRACRDALQALPHGDLRFYATALASADVDAVRQHLGAPRINAIGGSYGSRAALDYLRQFPDRVRRLVLDGVVPPDMRLQDTAARDNQAALDALLAACRDEPDCAAARPDLGAQWQALLEGLPRRVDLPHPVSGRIERVSLDRDTLLALVRAPLYAPALAAALPAAIVEAAQGHFAPLAALAGAVSGGGQLTLASGLHFSVVCSEDLGPNAPPAEPGDTAAAADPANDFGDSFQRLYRAACDGWPRAEVAPAFYTVPAAGVPVWLLSGGIDPVTPPRHAARVAAALGPRSARHSVVAMAGHGVLALPCVRDAVNRFVAADDDDAALAIAQSAPGCAAALPRPPAFMPPGWRVGGGTR